jgi:hypothetical protein
VSLNIPLNTYVKSLKKLENKHYKYKNTILGGGVCFIFVSFAFGDYHYFRFSNFSPFGVNHVLVGALIISSMTLTQKGRKERLVGVNELNTAI